MVILRITGADFAVPVKREADFVKLFAIACNVIHRCDGRVLSSLDGVLFCGKSVSIISHRVEHIETIQALVASIDVRSDVAQRMSHVETCARGIWEHVEDIEFLASIVFLNVVCLVGGPIITPLLFNFLKVVFHCFD